MKKLVCMLMCLCILLGTIPLCVSAVSVKAEDVDWGVTLAADEVTPTGMVIVIAQFGGHYQGELEYSVSYHLETLLEKGWEWVPYSRDVAFPLEADGVLPNSVYRMQENWEMLYGKLEPGRYRYVMKFIEWGDERTDDKEAEFYVDFAITDSHKCRSKDQDLLCDRCYCLVEHPCVDKIGDAECDICGKLISDENVYRVVGSAEWMGMWSPGSNRGIMKEKKSGIYQVSFKDVPAGEYSFMITKNGEWENSFGAQGGEYYEFSLDQAADLLFTLDIRGGVPLVSVNGPDPLLVNVPGNQAVYRVVGNADWMGNWDPANDVGVMQKISSDVYRKIFRNVPPGEYELKITKDGRWSDCNSSTDGNYCFVIHETQNIAVDFYWNGDTYEISVQEAWPAWLEAEDTENPSTADLDIRLPALILLLCVVAVPLLLRKRNKML